MSRRCLLSASLAAPFLGTVRASALAYGADVMVGLPNNVFAALHDGLPSGIMLEAIDLILRDMGARPRYIVMTGAEVAPALAEGMLGLNAVTVLTGSNGRVGYYTDPIVTEYNIVAVQLDRQLTVNHLADLHGLRLGGRQGYLYPLLDADPQIHLERFSQDGELIRNLIHGRIDAAIISALSDVYRLRAEGVMTRIRLLDRAVGLVPLRAVLSPRLFSAEDLAGFNRRLAELKAGDEWPRILERNGFADLAVEWPVIEG